MDNVSLVFSPQLPTNADAQEAHELLLQTIFLLAMLVDSHSTAPDDWVFPLPHSTPSHVADDNKTHIRPPHQHQEVSLAGSKTRLAH